jgi:SET domain-containing protein
MKVIKPRYPLYLKKVKDRGWAVFCSEPIPKGRVFETSPIIMLEGKHSNRLTPTSINEYQFEFRGKSTALVLGYGSLYNHSKKANCDYRINKRSRTYSFYSTKPIPANTEITHNYHWDQENYQWAGIRDED